MTIMTVSFRVPCSTIHCNHHHFEWLQSLFTDNQLVYKNLATDQQNHFTLEINYVMLQNFTFYILPFCSTQASSTWRALKLLGTS